MLLPAELWWLWVKRERRRGTGEIGSKEGDLIGLWVWWVLIEEGDGRDWVLRLLGFRKILCCVKSFFFFFNIMLTWKIVGGSEASVKAKRISQRLICPLRQKKRLRKKKKSVMLC